ncbi:MAG: polysaccharide export protein [Alphaproteobacteria bacterium]|nr:polysaccharide export protein [Alphaproteobacteria bacterium]
MICCQPNGLRLTIVLLATIFLSACAVPLGVSENAPLDVTGSQAYLLNPSDKVKVSVYGEETLVGELPIDERGMIVVPMIGEVRAAGLSKAELQEAVTEAFISKGYLSNPLVTVDIVTGRPFFIIGEVNKPGRYEYEPELDAFKAVAIAGGYTPRAARNRILIDRGFGEDKFRMNARENTPILPGDSITVRERIF